MLEDALRPIATAALLLSMSATGAGCVMDTRTAPPADTGARVGDAGAVREDAGDAGPPDGGHPDPARDAGSPMDGGAGPGGDAGGDAGGDGGLGPDGGVGADAGVADGGVDAGPTAAPDGGPDAGALDDFTLSCPAASTVYLWEETGTLEGETDDVSAACGVSSPGPDRVLRFDVLSGGGLIVEYRHSVDGVLYLFDACTGHVRCLEVSDAPGDALERIYYRNDRGSSIRVWVVLDSHAASGSQSYEISAHRVGAPGGP